MTLTLTARERELFARLARRLYRAANELPADDTQAFTAMMQTGMVLERMWREDEAKAETSASPPRVPVESGPGQPIPPHVPDVADALDGWAAQYSEPENINARHLREAAAEIRRLRAEQAALERILDQQQIAMPRTDGERRPLIDRVTIACWAANDKEDEKRGYRAGIEAALGAIEILLREPHYTAQDYTAFHRAFDAIRALADALKSEGG